ncbi:DUF4365 domain-containing protein [Pseudomonas batumici]|nr:DUF4365 domain-containing protein [Pseudomonas batumici]
MQHSLEPCPRCGSAQHVRPKEMLIGAASPKRRFNGEERTGYQRVDQLAVDECKPELLKEPPLQQLVDGFYCDQCGAGFVTSSIAQAANTRSDYYSQGVTMRSKPKRPSSHVIGNLAETMVEHEITARGWVYRRLEKDKDYGIDGEVEVFSDSGHATGIIFKVQVKGTKKYSRNVSLKSSTANYLSLSPLPVFVFTVEVSSGLIRFNSVEHKQGRSGRPTLGEATELDEDGFKLLEEIAGEHCAACLMLSNYTLHNASAQLIRCLDLLLNFGGDVESMLKWLRFFAPDEVLTTSYGYAVFLKGEMEKDHTLVGRLREWVIEFFPEHQERIDQAMLAFKHGVLTGRRLEVANASLPIRDGLLNPEL